MKDIVIIGAGGFGREIAWLIEDINEVKKEWNIIGFIDDSAEKQNRLINGYKVLGNIDFIKKRKDLYYVIAIGNSRVREKVAKDIINYNDNIATLIHPSVIMNKKNNKIGKGVVICAGSILTVNIKLGNFVIVNLDCTIGHDVMIDDFATIYPSTNISGGCTIGKVSELGTGTQVIQEVNICEHVIVGAGSVVIRDIEKSGTVVGVPVRFVKNE